MKTEFLKELGCNEEQIKKIHAENGKDIEAEKAKAKDALDLANEKNEALTKELTSKGVELEKLVKQSGDNADLTKALEELKTNHQGEIDKINKSHSDKIMSLSLVSELAKKFKDPKDVITQLDMEKIKFDNDKFYGLEEQEKEILEAKPYLGIEADGGNQNKSGLNHDNPAADNFMDKVSDVYGLPSEETAK